MLEVNAFTIGVPGFTLGPVDLSVKRGEFLSIIGPTGSGKSMLLEGIMGVLPENRRQFSGKVKWDGRDITHAPPEERHFGIVYQDAALFPHLNCLDNILYGTRYRAIDETTVGNRLEWLVNRFKIRHLLDRRPNRLSGGERQRVALARVLILEPRLILLDEPLSALDPIFRQEIRQLIVDLHHELGLTFIMVSHDFFEVRHMADSVILLSKGKIVQQGTPDEVMGHLGHWWPH